MRSTWCVIAGNGVLSVIVLGCKRYDDTLDECIARKSNCRVCVNMAKRSYSAVLTYNVNDLVSALESVIVIL